MSETLAPETAPDEAARRWRGRAVRWRGGSTQTGTGCSSWRRTRRSRPNTCCSSTISTASIRRWRRGIGVYLRAIQGAHGGWPLFHDGAFDLSRQREGVFRAEGDRRRPRRAAHGAGAARRSWRRRRGAEQRVHPRAARAVRPGAVACGAGDAARDHAPAAVVPVPPLKVSYWSRTVIVPLLVLMALQPRGAQPARRRNPGAVPHAARRRCATGSAGRIVPRGGGSSRASIACCGWSQPAVPARAAGSARSTKAVRFVTERLNGDDGLGGIYPAMANSVMMFDALGYPPDHPDAAIAWRAVRKLLVVEGRTAPTASPACRRSGTPASPATRWREAGGRRRCRGVLRWLRERQILDVVGDWAVRRPGLRPGGWAFQYANPHYPDVDDTAVVGMLLHRNGDPALRRGDRARRANGSSACSRRDGGWGAFDAGEHASLPQPHPVRRSWRAARSADRRRHRALRRRSWRRSACRRTIPCWRGRSGVSAARAGGGRQLVRPLGHQLHLRHLVGAVRAQRGRRRRRRSGGAARGGLAARRCSATTAAGARTTSTYGEAPHGRYKESTPSQTAWALLGLMAAGEVDHPAVARGIEYLVATQRDGRRMGARCRTMPSVSRACSICATTATAGISRCWRWRATAICGAATRVRVEFRALNASCRATDTRSRCH